jgi:hypothetical protein
VSTTRDPGAVGIDRADRPGRPRQLIALLAVLVVNALLIAAGLAYLVVELLIERPDSLSTAIAITVTVALALLGAVLVIVHLARGRAWARSGALVWQALQIALALGSFQGLFARNDIGWLLLAPALAAIVLLFLPAVVAATGRREG